jgi:hypothetical protein
MIKTKLFMIAVMGWVLVYYSINLLVINISVLQFAGIEAIITVSHMLYNKAKSDLITLI